MCLAIPIKLTEINGRNAVGEVNGLKREVRVDFISEPQVGDYVIMHAGFAIEKVDELQAQADLEAWKEVSDALSEQAD